MQIKHKKGVKAKIRENKLRRGGNRQMVLKKKGLKQKGVKQVYGVY
jgi:hypothetical protein